MNAGFAIVEAGFQSLKNCVNILVQELPRVCRDVGCLLVLGIRGHVWRWERRPLISLDDKALEPLAKRAAVAASPFPPFLSDLGKKPRAVVVPVAYE